MRVIGVAGLAGCGKDTIADYLVSKHGFHKIAFADPIKAMLMQIGINCYKREGKEEPSIFGKSPRQMAQLLGTEWMRNLIHPDGWVQLAAQRIEVIKGLNVFADIPVRGVIICDLRFENERQWLKSIGADVWHVYREVVPVSSHVSELPLPIEMNDAIFNNNEGIKELHEAIEEILSCG